MQVLDIEISLDEADENGRNHAQDQHRISAKQQTSKLFDCRTDTRIEKSSLTLYPVYNVGYQFEGRPYRMVLDGAAGEVVKAELPLTRGLRIEYAALSYLALSSLSITALYLSLTSQAGSSSGLAAIGSILAAIPLFLATASQRVKRQK